MKLAAMAVRRPVTILMMVAIVLVLGWVSLSRLPIDLFPSIEVPVVAIITSYPDAGPYEVESLVSRPMEEALGAVNNIKSVSSISGKGSSIVVAEFDWGIDMNFAALDVREKIDQAKFFMPDEAENPMVVKFDPMAMPVMQLVLNGARPEHELRYIAEHTIKNRLERLEGVASVSVSGGQEREIRIVLHPGLLAAHGVSIDAVSQMIRASSMNLPAGNIEDNGHEYVLRTAGELTSVDQIRSIKIPTRGGGLVSLTDIGEVEDGYRKATSLSRYNGQPSIMLSVQKEAGSNSVRVAEKVRAEVDKLAKELGTDISLLIAQDTSLFIKDSIKGVTNNAVIGGLLAMLVLLVFLRSLRPTFVIGLAIPISIVAAFTMIYFSKTTINMMSLGGLALGVGMLVDNAIVVLENIFRQRELGKNAKEAAQLGAEEVGMAITASTLTTVSVFIPVVFVSGIAAEIFRDMALTVTFSLMASLLVALTLVPMLASQIMGNGKIDSKSGGIRFLRFMGKISDGMQEIYGRLIAWVLRHRGATIAIAVATLVISLMLIPKVGMEFMPGMDQGEIQISVSMPKGTKLEETNEIVKQIEEYVATLPEIQAAYASIGGSGVSSMGITPGGGERGSVGLSLVPVSQRDRDVKEILAQVREFASGIPGATISVSGGDMMMGSFGQLIQIELRGNDMDLLALASEELIHALEEIEGTRQLSSSLDESSPEILVEINRDKAAAHGLSVAQIASTLRTAVSGTTVTKLRSEGKETNVVVRLGEAWRGNLDAVGSVPVQTARGTLVPLQDMATLRYGESPIQIVRSDQSRIVTITGDIAGRPLNAVMHDIRQLVDGFHLPEGMLVTYAGQDQLMQESFADLGQAMLLGILLVFMILASQFESLLQPLIIMVTLPLAIIGVILGLLIGKTTFNVIAFVGAIMLAGIVVNNAIVLIDYINQLRAEGMERTMAVITAGKVRLRPILMTTLTTVLGMIPMAVATGEGSEMAKPIAFTVIGGLITSTLLTLLVIPVVYTLMDGVSRRIMRLFGRGGDSEQIAVDTGAGLGK
ncbi:MAG: efflux RND transporter permease subunit [Firmicutes bacterium]|nr:efflux RND transporter permease subunit [Bacillota bacterium]